ncbi:MAG: DUF488 domain-containing protein [Elusimicrobia bacterium]|nr:DUF488 domain-containing protein [Elusimicrobiota bacterium]
MEIYTIGFTKKTAADFFGLLKKSSIKRLVDIRLNRSSQLSGFAKQDDLRFFLKEICDAEYVYEPLLAPTQNILGRYKKHGGNWDTYEKDFTALMKERKIETKLDKKLFSVPSVLLCSEHEPDHCHRRLAAEYLKERWGDVKINHL